MPTTLARLRETAYKIPKGAVEIALTCGHTAWYTRPLPAEGTDAFCRECRTWRRRKRARKSTRPSGSGARSAPPTRARNR
jgi:hypothetical protein